MKKAKAGSKSGDSTKLVDVVSSGVDGGGVAVEGKGVVEAPLSPLTAHARARLAGTRLDTSWHDAYLSKLSETGRVMQAVKAAGTTIVALSNHRKIMPEFAEQEAVILRATVAICEEEAYRRAVDGTEHPITKEVKYSDMLLAKILARSETGSWQDKQQLEVTSHVPISLAEIRARRGPVTELEE